MMSFKQQINLRFLIWLGKTPTETLKLLQEVYGDATMSRIWIFESHKRFKERRKDVEDDSRSGRPTTSRTNKNVEHMREKVSSVCLTVRMITDELSMNNERVWRIITEDRDEEDLCKNGTKVAKWCEKGTLCTSVLRRPETISN